MSAMKWRRVTTRGSALLLKIMQGTPVVFTKMAIGSGSISGPEAIQPMIDVVTRVANIPIRQMQMQDGTILFSGSFNNSLITEPFYYREIALFANDPNSGEIMVAYGNADDQADIITPSADGALTERFVTLVLSLDGAATVNVSVASDLYALQSDMDVAEKDIARLQANLFYPHPYK